MPKEGVLRFIRKLVLGIEMAIKTETKIRKENPVRLRIRQLMREKGIRTNTQLAGLLGFSPSALHGMLDKRFKPTPEKIALMSKILGIRTEEVCTLLDVEQEWRRTQAQQMYQEKAGPYQVQKTFYQVYELLCQGLSLQYLQSPAEKQREMILHLNEVLRACYTDFTSEYTKLTSDLTEILRGTFTTSVLEKILPINAEPPQSDLQAALDTLRRMTSEESFGKVLQDTYEQSKSKVDKTYEQMDLVRRIDFIEKLGRLVRRYERLSKGEVK